MVYNLVDKEGTKSGKALNFSLFGMNDGKQDAKILRELGEIYKENGDHAKAFDQKIKGLTSSSRANAEALKTNNADNGELSKGFLTAAVSAEKLTISTRMASAAMSALKVASNMLISAAVIGTVMFAINKIGELIVTSEEATEAAANLATEHQQLTSDLKSMNEELTTASKRMAELQAKGSLTFAEQSELDKLKSSNAELERQIRLMRIREDIVKGNSDKASTDAVNKKTEKSIVKPVAVNLDGTVTTLSVDKLTSVQEYMDNITSIQNQLATANQAQSDILLRNKAKAESILSDSISFLTTQRAEMLDSNPLAQAIDDITSKYDDFVNTDLTGKFNKIFEDIKFAPSKDEILSKAQASPDAVTGYSLNRDYPQMIADLDNVGISAEQAARQINILAKESMTIPSILSDEGFAKFAKNSEDIKATFNDLISTMTDISTSQGSDALELYIIEHFGNASETMRNQIADLVEQCSTGSITLKQALSQLQSAQATNTSTNALAGEIQHFCQ